MYQFEFDEDRLLLSITMTGYWTKDLFDAFSKDYLSTVTKVRATHGKFRILSDASEFEVQSAEVRTGFGELNAKLATVDTGPVAIVTSTVLNKMQAASVTAPHIVRIFMDRAGALEWLFSEGALN